MDAPTAPKPILGRQTSNTMRTIPSFNDFGSMVSEDISAELASTPTAAQTPRSSASNMMSVSVPKPSMIDRKWSVESDTMSPSTSR